MQRNAEWGARPWLIHTQLDYARLLGARAAPGDAEQAHVLLDEALTGAETLGMTRVVAEVRECISAVSPAARLAPSGGGDMADPSTPDRFCREGDIWTIAHDGHVCRIADAKGMRYLAHLLAHPYAEVHVLDLVGAPVVESSEQAMLDTQAKDAYRGRLRELTQELAEAEANHDAGWVDRLHEEAGFLEQELAAAVGLDGRDRTAVSQSERARVATTKAIRRAIENVARHNEALGRYLAVAIRTGRVCSYAPVDERTWHPDVRP